MAGFRFSSRRWGLRLLSWGFAGLMAALPGCMLWNEAQHVPSPPVAATPPSPPVAAPATTGAIAPAAPSVAAAPAPAAPVPATPAPAAAAPPARALRAPASAASPSRSAASKPAASATSTGAAAAAPAIKATAPQPAQPSLDLAALEQRLKDTKAIGVFTKLSLKNQVDDLLDEFKKFHQAGGGSPPPALRSRYDLLIIKVLTLLQDGDPQLASSISSSREALWDILKDPNKFAKI